jgi:DNA-binding FrmR family transcriptional regulator
VSTRRSDKIDQTERLLDRLARVEGQVRGLRKMVEEHRACEDVLTQMLAARSGLEQAGLLILDRHLADCVFEGAQVPPEVMEKLRAAMRLWAR